LTTDSGDEDIPVPRLQTKSNVPQPPLFRLPGFVDLSSDSESDVHKKPIKRIAGEHEKINAGDRILEHMSQPLPNNNRPPSKDNIQELIHGKITPHVREWAMDRFEECKPIGQVSQN